MLPNARAVNALELRGRRLEWGRRTYLMGIVNVTPDSFSGDGHGETEAAVAHALAQREAGADIIDVGGESTRPGHVPISAELEMRRAIPVVSALRAQAPDAILSIDTYKPEVFRAAHAAGCDMLNSIWGLDDELLEAVAERNVPVVIMHNSRVGVRDFDIAGEVVAYLERQAARALDAGIARERIVLDPGLGFGKNAEQNIALLRDLGRITALGFPTLIGPSRKATLGKLTGRPVEERAFATAAAVTLAIAAGVDVVRVHDVGAMRDVARIADAATRGWRPDDWEMPS